MRCILFSFGLTALLGIAQLPCAGQYGGGYPPGGYPGGYPGRYPGGGGGIGFPRRSKDKKSSTKDQTAAQQTQKLTGTLRKLTESEITVAADDARLVSAKRSDTTRFYQKGKEIQPDNLKPGDHVRVEATQDEQGYYHAVAVHLESEGTAKERADAAEAAAAEPAPTTVARDDPDRPVLRRKDPAPPPAKADSPEKAPVEIAKTTPPELAPEPERERPTTVVNQPPLREEADPTDPGVPRLKRGKPAARKAAAVEQTSASEAPRPEPVQTASVAPVAARTATSRTAPEDNEDPKILKARQAVATYTQSLPNYYCQEQMARYVSTSTPADWRALDVVSAALVFENGKENYRDLTINGKPVKQGIEQLEGSWSTGEFASMSQDVFSPWTAAEFRMVRHSTIAGRSAQVFQFDVAQDHSHWHVQVPGQSFKPAYKGSVWIDDQTNQVLRIEMQSWKMPKAFPLDTVESAVDYEYIRIADQTFLLPVHAETLSCVRGTSNCSRNVIDFRNYHKYTGQSTITFGN